MSASHWATCPRCRRRGHTEYETKLAKVMASYGKVPVGEFDEARRSLASPGADQLQTFREDYDINGADDGEVVVDYSGSCTKCGLRLGFTVRKPIPEVDL